jgi:hypothetical protein
MQCKHQIDLGKRVAEQLAEIRSICQTVDDAYRTFRAMLLENDPDLGSMPIEWLPTYDQ